MANLYGTGWRSGDSGGAVKWSDSWTSGQYAQQLKGTGTQDAEYLKRFDQLTKSDSSVDDEQGWRTVTSLENKLSGTKAEMQKQAAEWKSKGFDVRVQDLDDSHGAKWADLAVRKGPDNALEAEPEELLPATDSEHLATAKERVNEWNESHWSGAHANDLWGGNKEIKQYDFTNETFTGQEAKADELLNEYKTDLIIKNNKDSESEQPSASPVSNFSSANNA